MFYKLNMSCRNDILHKHTSRLDQERHPFEEKKKWVHKCILRRCMFLFFLLFIISSVASYLIGGSKRPVTYSKAGKGESVRVVMSNGQHDGSPWPLSHTSQWPTAMIAWRNKKPFITKGTPLDLFLGCYYSFMCVPSSFYFMLSLFSIFRRYITFALAEKKDQYFYLWGSILKKCTMGTYWCYFAGDSNRSTPQWKQVVNRKTWLETGNLDSQCLEVLSLNFNFRSRIGWMTNLKRRVSQLRRGSVELINVVNLEGRRHREPYRFNWFNLI